MSSRISGKATRTFLTRFLLFSIILILTSCAHMGDYEDEDDYYDAFGDIDVYDSDFDGDTYSMSDFYNDGMMDELDYPMDDDTYSAISIELKRDLNLDSLAFFMTLGEDMEEDASVLVTAYASEDDSFIDTLKSLKDRDVFYGEYIADGYDFICDGEGSVTVKIKKESEQTLSYETGTNEGYSYMEFTYPKESGGKDVYYISIENGEMKVYRNMFQMKEKFTYHEFPGGVYRIFRDTLDLTGVEESSTEISSFYDTDGIEQNRIFLEEGTYIILVFENNTALAYRKGLTKTSFNFTCLMIRSSLEDD